MSGHDFQSECPDEFAKELDNTASHTATKAKQRQLNVVWTIKLNSTFHILKYCAGLEGQSEGVLKIVTCRIGYTFFTILTNIQNVAVCIPYKITGKRIGILNGLGHECAKVLIIQRNSRNIQRKICQRIVLALISH